MTKDTARNTSVRRKKNVLSTNATVTIGRKNATVARSLMTAVTTKMWTVTASRRSIPASARTIITSADVKQRSMNVTVNTNHTHATARNKR